MPRLWAWFKLQFRENPTLRIKWVPLQRGAASNDAETLSNWKSKAPPPTNGNSLNLIVLLPHIYVKILKHIYINELTIGIVWLFKQRGIFYDIWSKLTFMQYFYIVAEKYKIPQQGGGGVNSSELAVGKEIQWILGKGRIRKKRTAKRMLGKLLKPHTNKNSFDSIQYSITGTCSLIVV